ncbi:hypothetical protein BY996DRAFT_6466184 [Phakopsora pachyrhizi]|nr:hypothetical protein BY996DRAFT_6466184 [Phakopsora pachyrhizi]
MQGVKLTAGIKLKSAVVEFFSINQASHTTFTFHQYICMQHTSYRRENGVWEKGTRESLSEQEGERDIYREEVSQVSDANRLSTMNKIKSRVNVDRIKDDYIDYLQLLVILKELMQKMMQLRSNDLPDVFLWKWVVISMDQRILTPESLI